MIILGATPLITLLSLIVYVLLPLLVGLVTKLDTSSTRRTILLTALSAITGFATEWLTAAVADSVYDPIAGAVNAIVALVIAIASYFGVWKPIGAARTLQAFGTTGTSGSH